MNKLIYSVSSLNRYVKLMLDNDINVNSIMVKGEVSNFTNHRSGHWYFTLKDKSAKISCVMFASYACKSKILLKEGMQVIVHASLSMYEAQGSCQLFVTSVQIDGLGDLYLALEQTKERMLHEGYFALEHKKPIPLYPMKIAVITAKTGAAIQDILATIARRWGMADVRVFPTLVQGIQASEHIITALQKADEKNFDVILLARGGGAIEDLWCFNDEMLAKCIYDMKTPIVTGVGHETDTTLVDYVSDARAPTPTAAAELITPNIEDVQVQLSSYYQRLTYEITRTLKQYRQRLAILQEHRYMKEPLSYVQQRKLQLMMQVKGLDQINEKLKRQRAMLNMLTQRLNTAAQKQLQERQYHIRNIEYSLLKNIENIQLFQQQCLKEKTLLLDAYSPLKILGRGYAIAYKHDEILHSTAQIDNGDMIQIRLQDGLVESIVKDVKGNEL